jgi:hypothetical protein
MVRNVHREPVTRYEAFVHKARAWFRAVRDTPAGVRIALLDVDTIVCGALDDAFRDSFDIAVTHRGGVGSINSGVVFARGGETTTAFFLRWFRLTARLAKSDKTKRFSDQDALKQCVAANLAAKVVGLPCQRWNCEQHTWKDFNKDTRIVHVKSDARKHLFNGEPLISEGAETVVTLWLAYAQAAGIAE